VRRERGARGPSGVIGVVGRGRGRRCRLGAATWSHTPVCWAWQGEKVPPEHHELVSVYFSDIVGFTTISSTITSAKVSCQPALPRNNPQ
jgi:hypothetical protein